MVQNCWEVKQCGREPGGAKALELGVCPAAREEKLDGVNNGKCGGRACWAIAGTLCGGTVQGTFSQKMYSCQECEFFGKVIEEEGSNLVMTSEILQKLQ